MQNTETETKMKSIVRVFILVFIAANVQVAHGHHSFAAEFLPDKTSSVDGVITQVWFKNPHARYYLEVTGENGETVTWDTRANSPSLLVRKGWTKKSIKVGDEVTIKGYLGRDGRKLMSIISVTYADGRVLRDKQEVPK